MRVEKGKNTLKEILSQSEIWESSLKLVEGKRQIIKKMTQGVDEVLFTGCGSNYYMAISAATHYQQITRQNARGVPASEIFLYFPTIFNNEQRCLLVTLSRSGETTEVINAANYVMKTLGYNSVTIGCYPDSKLSKISSERFILEEGQEKSVATTKSFTSMLLMTQAFAALKIENKEYYQQLAQLPSLGKQNIEKYHQYLKDIVNDKSLTQFVFLGSGPFYGIACESMLKMKEMALVPSDAFHSLEFRHGPRSILSKEVLVTLFISDTARNYEIELLEEIKSLGATTLAICDKTDENISDNADYLVETNSDRTEFARSIIYMPMTQLLAFHKAISRGINPDVPRNLTHFVKL